MSGTSDYNRRPWPSRHISLVEENWGSKTIAELAEETGRSKEAVRRLARKNGLPLLRPRRNDGAGPMRLRAEPLPIAHRHGVTLVKLKFMGEI